MRTNLISMLRPSIAGLIACVLAAGAATSFDTDLSAARDRQDLKALDNIISSAKHAAQADAQSGRAQYEWALANSYAAEVAMELRDKKKAEAYAEAGIEPARKAVEINQNDAEYHRLLGQICGQIIPANPFMGALNYGRCAEDEINKAIALNNKLALAYVSRGVGQYYLPKEMGGGLDLALQNLDKAIALDPSLSEAYIWKGIVLRKANRDSEAREAFENALRLDPQRLWTRQQLQKTPAH
ncbi:MAG: tetratricopeptide repeat protein [Acidobacteriaceae bacterium]|nr:tetratricopeptide repeat protein [Acidobacteriaceae bacterium]